jgi:uncharacterized protein
VIPHSATIAEIRSYQDEDTTERRAAPSSHQRSRSRHTLESAYYGSGVRDIRVVYRKYDQSLHWHMTMQYLGEDQHGIWAGMRRGGAMTKGANQPIIFPCANVTLFPRTGWWTAWFNAQPHEVTIYCDITTPPTWPADDIVTMVDLDLDVIRRRDDDSVHLVDEDEFAEHRVRFGYPPDVVEQAVTAARWLRDALAAGTEPFAVAYQKWLSIVDA